jgi:hypothetical protein
MRSKRLFIYLGVLVAFPIIVLVTAVIVRQSQDNACRWELGESFPCEWEGAAESAKQSEIDETSIARASEHVELDIAGSTPTATEASSSGITATSEIVIATADQDTPCRSGPQLVFPVMRYLSKGESAVASARTDNSNWYRISTEEDEVSCWVWHENLILAGDAESLPIEQGPQIPTEAPESIGCWVENDPQYPNGICKPSPCGPNEFPATPCNLP